MNFNDTLSAIFETYAQQELNPKLWDGTNLRPKIAQKLRQIAEDFAAEYDIPKNAIEDTIITGSLANYTWTEFSDIDIHLVVDFAKIHADTELVEDYYRLAKVVWNHDHTIEICGHEVELYVQDMSEDHYSTGVYSLQDHEWLVIPKKGAGSIPDEKQVDDKAEKYITQIDNIEYSADHDEDTSEDIKNLRDKIKTMRQAGLSNSGEYSLENLVFKKLRNGGHLEKLSNLRKKSYDKKMSVECPTD